MTPQEKDLLKEIFTWGGIVTTLYNSTPDELNDTKDDMIDLFKLTYYKVMAYTGTNESILNGKQSMINFLNSTDSFIPQFKDEILKSFSISQEGT